MTTTNAAGAQKSAAKRAAHPGLILLIIAGAQLMVVLDSTIVNIALPKMGDYFHKNQTQMTWAINAYTLAFGGLLLLGGRAGDILGRRRMFMIGLTLFTVGSFLGGIAPSFEFLLVGRVIQGIGGAIASPTALSLITTEFEEGPARTRAFAVFSAVAGAGAALGLLLGGLLTQVDWRWVLFVNVPIGVVLVAGAFFYLHESERLKGRFDWYGGVLVTAGMSALVYGFIHAASDGWSNGVTIGSFVLSVVLLVGFVITEAKLSFAIMPLHIFRNGSRSGAYIVMLIIGAAMFGMFFFVTYFVQGVLGYSALKTGLAFLPVAFVIGISAQVSAMLLPALGPRYLIMAGSAIMTGGMFWLATIERTSGYLTHLLPSEVVLAFGIGLVFVPLTTVAVAGVEPHEAGLASALLNVGQQVGGSIGLSVLTTVFASASNSEFKTQLAKVIGMSKSGAASAQAPQHFAQLGSAANAGGTAPPAAAQDNVAVQAVHQVLAYASGKGFLTAAILAVVAFVVTVAMIRTGKDDVPAAGASAVAMH